MTLRDERDQLLDELSAYAKIDVVEDQTGFVSVELEGSEFIIDRGCMNMGVLYDSDTTFYTPYWPHLSNDETQSYIEVFNLTYDAKTENNTDIGKVKSLLIQRGDHFGNKSDMESLEAYSKIESSTMMEVEAELDQMYGKVVDIINNLFAPNLSVEDSAATFQSAFNTITVSDEDIDAENSTYKLLSGKSESNTYYEVGTANGKTQIVAAESAQILDVDNAYYGIDHELPPREIFVRNSESRYTEVVSPLNGETYYVLNAEDPENSNTWYHIGTTRINDELQKQITLMPAYQGDGDVAYDLGEALSVAWSSATLTLNPTDNNVTNFESYYNKMIDKLATDGSIYSAASDTLKATTASLESSRQQVTGVSSDEELTNMVKFQSAYNASSRFMTVISQMTETIVGLI
jgi:flagellar hook-associated protein 1 FlgK